jgi:hypothetical protein
MSDTEKQSTTPSTIEVKRGRKQYYKDRYRRLKASKNVQPDDTISENAVHYPRNVSKAI